MLNPVLSSAFFIGVIVLIRHKRDPKFQWIFWAMILCFLPGFLASDYVEFNRVIQTMPFIILIAAMGLLALLSKINKNVRWIFFCLLIVPSVLLDIHHLLIPMADSPYYQAYKKLDSLAGTKGPGIIYTDFMPLSYGHSLNVMSYHFNAAANPVLDLKKSTWAGVVTQADTAPYLLQRFAGAYSEDLGNKAPVEEASLALVVVPINLENRETFERWADAQEFFNRLNLEAENSYNNNDYFVKGLEDFKEGYSRVKDDPYLRTCYWEWGSQYQLGSSHEPNVFCLQNAIREGYPAPHLYFKLGNLMTLEGKWTEAREAYQTALKMAPGDRTILEALQAEETARTK
jgi:tetratricopeptide (TPR) repeat protein